MSAISPASADFDIEKLAISQLAILNLCAMIRGIFRLKAMQAEHNAQRPPRYGRHEAGATAAATA
ncbi:MAG: hypothetical protein IPG91_19865 [Ideonella sp.]|nr:hypothetical protein [Ideonella sp.]